MDKTTGEKPTNAYRMAARAKSVHCPLLSRMPEPKSLTILLQKLGHAVAVETAQADVNDADVVVVDALSVLELTDDVTAVLELLDTDVELVPEREAKVLETDVEEVVGPVSYTHLTLPTKRIV